VIPATIEAMKNHFKTNPKDMIAGIGPSIGPDHYEVGEEVVKQVVSSFGADSSGLLDQRHGRVAFDLWSATRLQLQHLGVEKIQTAGLCTACHLDDWYSHRAEHGHTGRFGAMISLQE
jgi:copper oxidase (laccase) domain-containing protein